MPLLPKFLKRKNPGRRGRRDDPPVVMASPLSPVSEHSVIHLPASDSGSPRPVPPPQLVHSHVDDFDHHSMRHDDFRDDLHDDPHNTSRLYETFSQPQSQDGHTVPRVIREADSIGPHLDPVPGAYTDTHSIHRSPSLDGRPDVLRSEHPEEIAYVQSDRSGPALPVFIAPSDHSAGSSHSSQKVTFLGDLRSHDRTPSMHKRALSASSRSMPSRDRRPVPVVPSTIRDDYRRHHRIASEPLYPTPPRMTRPEFRYEFRRPYLIFTDFGEGLEIGNEEDGFMLYEDYRDSGHLRSNRQDTYYIIPGSTPVIFHDDNGNELYRVDAWKYNTPTLRRRQYIIEGDNGKELFRVGGSGSSRYSSDGHSSTSSGMPKIQYLNSEFGSMHHRPNLKYSYKNKRPLPRPRTTDRRYNNLSHVATPLARSALFEDDEMDDRTVSSNISSNPDIIVVNEDGERVYDSRHSLANIGAQSPRTRSQYATEVSYPSRPESGLIDEYRRPIERSSPRSPALGWGTSSSETDESYEGGSHRHSQVFRA